jgi:UPF0716 protein FxsA
MNFVITFFLLVVFFSSAELLLILKVAANFGFITTFVLCALTGILGGALVRAQGLQTLRDIQTSLRQGSLPAEEIVGGFMLIIIGALLMVPGFITDTMGFLLLFPPLRRRVARTFVNTLKDHIQFHVSPIRPFSASSGQTPSASPEDETGTIETEVVGRRPEPPNPQPPTDSPLP